MDHPTLPGDSNARLETARPVLTWLIDLQDKYFASLNFLDSEISSPDPVTVLVRFSSALATRSAYLLVQIPAESGFWAFEI